jgi:hypothetical protein
VDIRIWPENETENVKYVLQAVEDKNLILERFSCCSLICRRVVVCTFGFVEGGKCLTS